MEVLRFDLNSEVNCSMIICTFYSKLFVLLYIFCVWQKKYYYWVNCFPILKKKSSQKWYNIKASFHSASHLICNKQQCFNLQKINFNKIKRHAKLTHQCTEMLYGTWLTTLTTTLSPSLATILGPGNWPFTVTMLFVWQSLVTFFICICQICIHKRSL
jgi:hypothetical protein